MIKFNRKFDPRKIRLLIFDLDGTLIDSRRDLVHSVNAMLRHFGRPELPGDVIVTFVGDGLPMLVRRALGDPKDERFLREAVKFFLAYYRIHKLDHTHVYDGIKDTLVAIGAPHNGFRRKMVVLSNKPVDPSRAILEALGLSQFFVSVYGGNSFATKKPDPLGAKEILKETGSRPAETLMIGDSANDVFTGRNAGLWTCGVSYGFAPHTLGEVRPDVVVDTPRDLAEILNSHSKPSPSANPESKDQRVEKL